VSRLQITNGDAVAGLLERGGLVGERLPWRDVLHDGPVPAGLSLGELSRLRARFVAANVDDRGFERVLADFTGRDRVLESFKQYDEVTLWFEHDLYDQLQLIQLLAWFSRRETGRTRLSLVCVGEHAEVQRFLGLGQLSPEQLVQLDERREEVTGAQLEAAARGWEAYCSDRPTAVAALTAEDLDALPFLRPALIRHLEQFPWTRDGLSRTERQILECVAAEPAGLRELFRLSHHDAEEAPFLGDRSFLFHLATISGRRSKLVQYINESGAALEEVPGGDEVWERRVQITEIGRKTLAGQADHVRLFGIDRWLGGVHLCGDHAAWRWDDKRRSIVALSA